MRSGRIKSVVSFNDNGDVGDIGAADELNRFLKKTRKIKFLER